MWRPLVVAFILAISSFKQIESGQISSNIVFENDPGHGIQVVNVVNGTGARYQLDLDNLKGLLLRKDVADLPVAVVSIAGPFRGGKSFLLDFFLRYLKAPRSKQLSGQWMGDENEPLTGFHWRGGSNRDTTGIHMWSEPFHIKLEPSGEEVVVLLMDTQGTFDSKSSLRDSTTIFAMSTLLSSVQIYNLFRNIAETDLQHLQLFTDYGQKVSSGGAAFQELMFLIRDWTNPYEYDYGYNGGNLFLAEKLMEEPGQIPELRQVRQHIHSCFSKLTCFLMPHPGLKVAKKVFNGSLADIEEDFKTSLLEMMTSLFDPKNLTPKSIGGVKITGRDLMMYFTQYGQVFNSDKLPDITTILEGTKAAAIMAAVNAARHEYSGHMDELDTKNQSYTSDGIRAKHEAARDAAIKIFTSRIMLGDKKDTEKALADLKSDLDQFQRSYQYNNDIKLRSGLTAARKSYDKTLFCKLGVELKQKVCVHPLDLEQFHQDALTCALSTFDSLRVLGANETDEERKKLDEDLVEQYNSLRLLNVNNNKKATQEAHTLYLTTMSAHRGFQDPALLYQRHNDSATAALRRFDSMRNVPTKRTEDTYRKDLLQTIATDYEEFKKNNTNPNKVLLNKALQVYNDYVKREWQPVDACYHPQDLLVLHDEGKNRAIQEFQRSSIAYEKGVYLEKLNDVLQKLYDDNADSNDYNNGQAVDAAYQRYVQAMDAFKAPTNMIDDFFKNFSLSTQHSRLKSDALSYFNSKRRGKNNYSYDKYVNRLEDKIDSQYSSYETFWSRFADKVAGFFRDIFG